MNIINQVYAMRKRIPDKELLKIKQYIEDEIDRRLQNDKQAKVKV